ncbi:MAG: thiamine pyrophosphate-dependent enzyme [Planctomycetota bacterium]|jgi:transketolase|nr:thiamine pyrophosphate-dependent enzyme [Planctomycetota bacterium]
MGAELEAPAEIPPELRHRAPLSYPNPLAGNPAGLKKAVSVTGLEGGTAELADPKYTRLALALMNMNAVHGGAACHWGGPAAFAEIMSAIHGIMFAAADWKAAFNFVNDAGHAENGIYALKANYGYAGLDWADLKGFRSVSSKLTGHGESHLFADGVMVSNGPLGSGLPIAQGLALADKIAANERVTVCSISDGAMMEGEAKEAAAAIPGMARCGQLNPFVLILSDNNTKLSGRIDEMSFGMKPSFTAMHDLGWAVIEVEDGHDLQAVYNGMENAVKSASNHPEKPVFLWVKTIKGKGVAKTEQSSSGGHGYPLKNGSELRPFLEEINGGPVTEEPFAGWMAELEAEAKAKAEAAAAKPKSSGPKANKVQAGYPAAMITAAEAGKPVVSVSADLQGSTGVAPFHAAFPQFSYDVGIAESNMVSVATGLSKQGYIPVVDTFVQFGVTKGNLPLTMGVLSQSPCLAVFSHCGFQDAADGASHQGLYYIAATAAIPHLTQYCAASAEEAEWAMGSAIEQFCTARAAGKSPDSVLFFCGRENFPVSIKPDGASYAWGKAMVLADTTAGKDKSVTISAVGYMAAHALTAAERLAEQGIGAIVLQNSTPNKPDVAGHQAALAKTGGKLVTLEDHQKVAGAGAILVAALAEAGATPAVKILGVDGAFGQSAYSAIELYDQYGMGPDGVVAAATAL